MRIELKEIYKEQIKDKNINMFGKIRAALKKCDLIVQEQLNKENLAEKMMKE